MQEIAKASGASPRTPLGEWGAYSAPPDTLFGAGGGYPLRQPPPSALRAAVLGASRLVSWRLGLLQSELLPIATPLPHGIVVVVVMSR